MKLGKIRTRLMIYYVLLLSFSLLVSGILYQRLNREIAENKIGEVSEQTLYAIQANLQSLFDNTNKYSQRIIANGTVQDILRHDWTGEGIAQSNRRIQLALSEIVLAEPTITSVFLFRNDGAFYSLDNEGFGSNVSDVRKAPWYSEVVEKNGNLIWRIDGGGIFLAKPTEERYLSLIRLVNDVNTAEHLGVAVVNIPLAQVKKYYERVLDANGLDLMAQSDQADLISFANPELRIYAEKEDLWSNPGGTFFRTVGGKRYLLATTEAAGWKYATALPVSDWSNPYESINRVLVPIALFNFLFIFLGSIWISRSITGPILRLLVSMRRVDHGDYQPVKLSRGSGEIRQLQERYNMMIRTIEQSILREKENQVFRRKLELDILHQQIKPHFLYNALESAGYLSLTGEKHEAYRLITALADYYKRSLSKGNEVISLRQEFEMTRNYLTIQAMRYPSVFQAEFRLEEEAASALIPKLSLQPLTENALYHGVRPLGEEGVIRISAFVSGSIGGPAGSGCRITIKVEDDGVGMTEEQLSKIKEEALTLNASSFGLRGTIARLKLYYGDQVEYDIASAPGAGTAITIVIPYEEGTE